MMWVLIKDYIGGLFCPECPHKARERLWKSLATSLAKTSASAQAGFRV